MSTLAYRYALYFCPPDPWRAIGNRWLGRAEPGGLAMARTVDDVAHQHAWTEAPRRYGLHATLKAPFRLCDGTTPDQLDAAVRELAGSLDPFSVLIERRRLRGFLAWCLADDGRSRADMGALADVAVQRLDRFRAPPTRAEIERRQAHTLSEAERRMLARWGYPYAFQTFKFHITLTGHLSDANLLEADREFAQSGGDELPDTMPVEGVALYVEPQAGADFIVARHYGFDGRVSDAAGAIYLPPWNASAGHSAAYDDTRQRASSP
jgi:2'-5' RNA ligase